MSDPEPITRLFKDWRGGNDAALEQLTPLVYDELRRVAGNVFRAENPGHTLQPTAIVNEVFLKIANADLDVNDRVHFFSLAARMMRRLLVDHAKAKRAAKRGGGAHKETLDENRIGEFGQSVARTLDLDSALTELADIDPRKAHVLEMHYFGGLTYDEMSEVLGVARATLNRDLRAARAWLRSRLEAEPVQET